MFTLTIKTENDAFQPIPQFHLSTLLRRIAKQLDESGRNGEKVAGRAVMDENGNKVGEWDLTA